MRILASFFSLLTFLTIVSSQIMIYNCSQLQSLTVNDTSVSYLLANDIDCSSVPNFSPVGNCSQNISFQGVLDGQNHVICNIFMNRSENGVGIIGNALNATIKNIRIQNATVYVIGPTSSILENIGILLGVGVSTVVTNCHLEGNESSVNQVKTNGGGAGGLIGTICNMGSLVANCTVTNTLLDGDPVYSNSVGCVVGAVAFSAVMADCHNFGFIGRPSTIVATGGNAVGGVVGFVDRASLSRSGITQGT